MDEKLVTIFAFWNSKYAFVF